MLTELLFVPFALVLLFYWFRYNCRLLLRTAATGERARQVAAANELRFPHVLDYLQQELSVEELEALNEWLLRDYDVLTSLLDYTSGTGPAPHPFAQRTLLLDFKLQKLWFTITRKYLTGPARHSLEERSHILAHFANTMSARSAVLSRA